MSNRVEPNIAFITSEVGTEQVDVKTFTSWDDVILHCAERMVKDEVFGLLQMAYDRMTALMVEHRLKGNISG